MAEDLIMSARRDAQPVDLGHHQNSDNTPGRTRKSTESDSEDRNHALNRRSISLILADSARLFPVPHLDADDVS